MSKPLPLPEYRILHQDDTFRVDCIQWDADRVNILDVTGCPEARTLEEMKTRLEDFQQALHRPAMIFPKEGRGYERRLFDQATLAAATAADPEVLGYDYRVGSDPRGQLSIYQCVMDIYIGNEVGGEVTGLYSDDPVTSCGYSEDEILQDLLLYVKAVDKPVFQVREVYVRA